MSLPKYCGMISFAALVGTVSSFVDGCITGRFLGADAMAAFGTAMPFVLLIVIVGSIVLSTGGSICASRDIGQGKLDKANSGFTACCILGLALGIFGFAVCCFFSAWLISLTGTEGELASEAAAYIKGFAFGAVPTVILTIMMSYANVDGNEKHSLIAVLIMIVSDIAMDIVLGIRMKLGLWGLALATSISYFLAMVYFLWVLLSGKSAFSFRINGLRNEIKEILRFGYPSALNTLLVSGRCFFINRILLSIAGSDAVSAFSFQSNFNQFFVALATGVSTSISVLTGIFAGEGDSSKIRASIGFGTRTGVAVSAVFGIALFAFSPMLSKKLMTGTAAAIGYSTQALRFFSISLPLSMICIILISFYQTLGNRALANFIAVAHGMLWPLVFSYALSCVIGLKGVWAAAATAELVTLVCVYIYSFIHNNKGSLRRPGLIMLDDASFPDESSVFSLQREGSAECVNYIKNEFLAYINCYREFGSAERELSFIIDSLSDSLTDILPGLTLIDAQGYCKEDTIVLNLRFPGEETDRLLRNEKSGIDIVSVSHHYSAGISFVNLKVLRTTL